FCSVVSQRAALQLIAKGVVQPVQAQVHPPGVVSVGGAGLLGAHGHAVAAVGEEVGLGRHPGVVQGGEHLQAVLHGDAVVLHGVPQKGRAGVLGDVLVQGEVLVAGGAGLAAADVADGALVGKFVGGDDRVAQNHGVGPV